MARYGGLGSGCRSEAQGLRILLCVAGLLAVWGGQELASQIVQVQQNGQVPTLHVYTNLVQIPTLVLGHGLEQIDPIAENRFSVSVDSGPWFRATHVRREGDDPISLAVLLDMRFGSGDFIPKLRDTIADLAPSLLHERDHVSIYVLGCDLMRSLNDVPVDAGQLRNGVDG